MQSKAKTIEAYLASLTPDDRAVISGVNAVIRRAAPHAIPTMKYGMPTYDLGSDRFVALNAQKNYYSFYADPAVVAQHKKTLGHLDCGKSCVRFKRLADLPLDTIEAIVRKIASAS